MRKVIVTILIVCCGCFPVVPLTYMAPVAADPFPVTLMGHQTLRSFYQQSRLGELVLRQVNGESVQTVSAPAFSSRTVSLASRMVISYSPDQYSGYGMKVPLLGYNNTNIIRNAAIHMEGISRHFVEENAALQRPYISSELRCNNMYVQAFTMEGDPLDAEGYLAAGYPSQYRYDTGKQMLLVGTDVVIGQKTQPQP